MLHKALKENIVVERTDLYDRFFVLVDECKVKASVTRLPYFDGDYLPDVIEDSINVLQQEEDERKAQKRGRKPISRRALRAAGYASLSGDTSKDILLMQKDDPPYMINGLDHNI
ncbi:probable histone acetyltransferase HAC-like 1 [Magnolia sinica]|uniref:probable histone acetyltransferase HAC-like 1 n=1 Tax=Magnolia sinica TaxID=86752 RepID=UPI002658856B|nr:probable histone acetyltransferase HAC-like 1 [Magnolia sinica]